MYLTRVQHRQTSTPQSVENESATVNEYNPDDLEHDIGGGTRPSAHSQSTTQRRPPVQRRTANVPYYLGNMSTNDEREATREINRNIQEAINANSIKQRVLFLGPGGSGKSTIIKQFRYKTNREEMTQERLQESKGLLIENALSAMKILCEQIPNFSRNLSRDVQMELDEEFERMRDEVMHVRSADYVTRDIAQKMHTLWTSEVFEAVFSIENRRLYQIEDNARYLLDKIVDIIDDGYQVTFDDYVYARKPTHHVRSYELHSNPQPITVLDVGGQRGQRKKWVPYFDNVDVVAFVASLAGYVQTLQEDEVTIRIQEARSLFEYVMTLNEFQKVGCIVFLNKLDLFEEFIARVPLTNGIPEYPQLFAEKDRDHFELSIRWEEMKGDPEAFQREFGAIGPLVDGSGGLDAEDHVQKLLEWIEKWFLFPVNRKSSSQFCHVIAATDCQNMQEKVIVSVQHQILNLALQNHGLK